jgi:hypothetical protein
MKSICGREQGDLAMQRIELFVRDNSSSAADVVDASKQTINKDNPREAKTV